MTARSRQAAALARALSAATGTACRVEFHFASDLGGADWRVHWCDGPTTTEMQATLGELVAEVAPLLADRDVGCERSESDLGAATSLLWWLAQDHPDDEGPIDLWFVLHGGVDSVLPGRPDTAPAGVQRRARVLVDHGWSRYTAGPLAIELERQARGGWLTVAGWLDALDAVPTLTAPRATTSRRRPE